MRLYLIALLFYIAGLCAALAYDLARHTPRSKVITYPHAVPGSTRAGRRRYQPSRWEAARLGVEILFSSARYGLSL